MDIYAPDAANAAWSQQQAGADAAHAAAMASSDLAHRRFSNMIVEERTVTDGAGSTWQVHSGYDRYF